MIFLENNVIPWNFLECFHFPWSKSRNSQLPIQQNMFQDLCELVCEWDRNSFYRNHLIWKIDFSWVLLSYLWTVQIRWHTWHSRKWTMKCWVYWWILRTLILDIWIKPEWWLFPGCSTENRLPNTMHGWDTIKIKIRQSSKNDYLKWSYLLISTSIIIDEQHIMPPTVSTKLSIRFTHSRPKRTRP